MGGYGKGNNNMKGRAFGVMLILAFGATLFGVMLFQRFRERSIFNLLVKQKDHQLYSLQLLLQKEKDHTNELKRKMLGTKSRMYSLRNQKLELDSRVLEMQTSIASLQDENRAIKLVLEEKQNEISMLTEKETESNKEVNSQSVALTEILKQKEAEIEDLKNQLKYPVQVLSIKTDDLSVPTVNLTDSESMNLRSKFESTKSTEREGVIESAKNGENSEIIKMGNEDDDRRETREEKLQMSERSQENGLQGKVDVENTSENGGSNKKETVNQETGNFRDKKREISKFLQKIGTVSAASSRLRRRHGYLTAKGRIVGEKWITGNQNNNSSRISETEHNERFNGLTDDPLNVSQEKRGDDNGSKFFTSNISKQKQEDGRIVETMEQKQEDGRIVETMEQGKSGNSSNSDIDTVDEKEPKLNDSIASDDSNTIATDGENSVEQGSEIEANKED